MIYSLLDLSLKRRRERDGQAVKFVSKLNSTYFDREVAAAVQDRGDTDSRAELQRLVEHSKGQSRKLWLKRLLDYAFKQFKRSSIRGVVIVIIRIVQRRLAIESGIVVIIFAAKLPLHLFCHTAGRVGVKRIAW